MARPRIYLTGHVVIEHGALRVDEHQLAGRQGRLAFVYLTCHRTRPIGRGELSCAIWGDRPPPEVEGAINALLSKLRNTLKTVGLEPPETSVETRSGSINLRLPADAWVDLEAAGNAIDETRRGALRALLVRALACLAEVSRANGEPGLAIQYTSEILELEPFRETAYQALMRLHASAGNRAEALRAFGRCRELLRDELGASPSPQTEAVFLEILRDGD